MRERPKGFSLEKIRLSITRLKLLLFVKKSLTKKTWKDKTLDYEIETDEARAKAEPYIDAWKDKTLDYEIETGRIYVRCWLSAGLEKIRLSITRLKPLRLCVTLFFFRAWKDKTLDYEIETGYHEKIYDTIYQTWKDKTLDYEIETQRRRCFSPARPSSLKR